MIHRDLKPANIMLSWEQDGLLAEEPRVRILDFGLARTVQDQLSETRSSVILGTPLYMAPEQVGSARAEQPADIFSIGTILYELLTGQPPFPGETIAGVFESLQKCEVVSPSKVAAGIDADLDTICLRCLRRHPGDRYESAEAVASDLRRYFDGRPVQARPVGISERLDAWVRHPDRQRQSGLVVAALNLLTFLWTIATALRVGLTEGPDAWSGSDLQSIVPTILIIDVLHLFLVYIGWRAAKGRIGGVLIGVGFAISLAFFIVGAGGLFGLMPPLSPWHARHPVANRYVHSFVGTVTVCNLVAFAVLLRCWLWRRSANR